jgi:hypothetical protein
VESDPRYRFAGPGLTSTRYTGVDQLEPLEDLRDLMNYVVRVNLEEGRRPDDTK